MAKKSAAMVDLDRGAVTTAANAARVEDVYRLTAHVLLSDDVRVQAAFRAFQDHVAITSHVHWDSLLRDQLKSLVALVAELGLSRYSWLPGAIFWHFCRAAGYDDVALTLPREAIAELDPGRAPKRGETHHEDHERYLRWWYRVKVKHRADSIHQLAREWVEVRRAAGCTRIDARKDVRDAIRRAVQLLACLKIASDK